MGTKCGIASKVASEGVAVMIARGDRPGVLVDLIERPEEVPHTLFEPSPAPLSNIKRWLAHSGSFAKGIVRVNRSAAEALVSDRAVSLLPVGVTAVEGEWEEGDIVSVLGPEGERLGMGRASMSGEAAAAAVGKHGAKPLIHYDYLYLE